MIENRQ